MTLEEIQTEAENKLKELKDLLYKLQNNFEGNIYEIASALKDYLLKDILDHESKIEYCKTRNERDEYLKGIQKISTSIQN